MDFNSARTGTGTAEWAEVAENICLGCSNACLYCYAAHNMNRFGRRPRSEWAREELTKRASMTSYPARDGVVMFPSSHDITPFNVEAYVRVASLILAKGNRLLIVTKPRLSVVRALLCGLLPFQKQILFRFTIGTMDPGRALFWEPGASPPTERIECLRHAAAAGFRTSVSIEPIVGGIQDAMDVVGESWEWVTDTIWCGKMNKIRLRVNISDPAVLAEVEEIERLQSDENILALYEQLRDAPYIRWKDSIQAVVAAHRTAMVISK